LLFGSRLLGQSPFLIDEEFDNAPTAPSGWTFTGVSNYTSGTNSGKSTPSVKFSSTGNQITSPTWANGDQITFVIRATNTPNSSDNLLIEVYNGSWSTLANVKPHTTAFVKCLNISAAVTKARFTYTKGNTNIMLDDFTVRASGACTGNQPYIESINEDACGSGCEGRDEFFTFYNGNSSLNISDIEFSYPDANNSTVTWCGTAANAPCDNYITINTSEVTALNALAGCPVFTSPSGSIPANNPVMVFNGNPQNTRTNFSSLCSGSTPLAKYYALFANNPSDCNGRFGNYNSTSSCSPECYRDFFLRNRANGCTDTNYYFENSLANADGASTYYATQGSAPNYVNSNCANYIVLPILLTSFYAIKENNDVKILWQTATEQNVSYFMLEKSIDGINFNEFKKVNPTNTNATQHYGVIDNEITNVALGLYYRFSSIDRDGSKTFYKIIFVPFILKEESINISSEENQLIVQVNQNNVSAKTIEIYDAGGNKLLNVTFNEAQYIIPNYLLENKVCLLRITSANNVWVKKIIISASR